MGVNCILQKVKEEFNNCSERESQRHFWSRHEYINDEMDEPLQDKISDVLTKYLLWITENPEKSRIACERNWDFMMLNVIEMAIESNPNEEITDIEAFYNFVIDLMKENSELYFGWKNKEFNPCIRMCSFVVKQITKILQNCNDDLDISE